MKKIIKKIFWFFSGINKYNWSYRLIALIGLIIRVAIYPIIFPNWFEPIADFFISQLGLPIIWYQILLRIVLLIADTFIVTPIFYGVSYATVGASYESGSCPWWGSICYTLYYGAYMAMAGCIVTYFEWWVIIVAFIGYLVLSTGIYLISAFATKTLPIDWWIWLIIQCFIFALVLTATCLIKAFMF